MRTTARYAGAVLGAVVTLVAATPAHADEIGAVIRVSVGTDGTEGDDDSREPAISADGRYVVFSSESRLAPADTNYADDVYLRDTATGTTELISVGPDGNAVPYGDSNLPRVSADGRYVAFTSSAAVTAGTTGGTYLRDRGTGTTTRVGPNSYWFDGPDLSADGRYVVFTSTSDALPQDRNGSRDVYLWDNLVRSLSVVSIDPAYPYTTTAGDSESPTISDNGRYIAFRTRSSVLGGSVDGRVVVRDRWAGTTTPVSAASVDGVGAPAISGDGNWIAYSKNRGEHDSDVLLWERATGTTSVASVNTAGRPASGVSLTPRISGDGRYVVYYSSSRELVAQTPSAPVSFFLFDRLTGRNSVAVTPPDDAFYGSETADISDDGRYVASETESATLVPGDTNGEFDVFRTRVS
ncbi:hypothetical protein Val02_64880 [Virgisporangium aliadipatigenens]|uniref:Uncharacterized protein n=1 Tax=Virgisporangium aliadipatigenens TaxID=741659 RepID=A0A8J4DUX9_9ACTN|nr:PD40 domain-containing protein [Virgisporangium aliadipatigenens]GIJ49602.1 hypothetical protein Val02_64880 [Virgisporangium aliadipatigenens]